MVSNNEEDRLSYLLSGSCDVLPSSYIKLRSHLNIHSANLAEHHNFKIFRSRMTSCPYCYTSWTCDTSSFQLLPSKKIKSQKKINSGKKINAGTDQKATEESKNVLVLKCKVCTRKSTFSLVKKSVKEKVQREEDVKFVKKRRKKKDKSCGLRVKLDKNIAPSPQPFAVKRKSGLVAVEKSAFESPTEIGQENTQQKSKCPINLPKINPQNKSNQITQHSKKLVINPFAVQSQSNFSRKKGQKLKELKKAVKGGKDVVKKTLKDFLTLI